MANPHLRTRHNYDAFEVVSALQKCIRRGLEEDALYWAYELGGIAEQKPLLVVVGAGKGHRLRGRRSGESHHASLDRRLVAQLEGEKGGAAMVHQRRHRVGAVAESRIVDNALNMQLSEDELGWRRDKPIPYVSSRQGCESCEVRVLVPPIACSWADSMSDTCEGNDARSARM